ncbi:hypothetical protein XANCAGTX0491_000681 [Xanthoria calcicola]
MPAFWIGRRSPHSTALPSDKLDLIVNLVLGLLGIVLSVIAVWQGYWIWRIWTTSKEQPSVTEESTTAEEGGPAETIDMAPQAPTVEEAQ